MDRNNAHSKDDYCRRFNKGRCTFGLRCRFEHRCQYCHKFGHGIHNCRKLIADKKEKESNNRNLKNAGAESNNLSK